MKLPTEEKKKNASKAASLEEMLPKSSLHHMLSGSYSVKHCNNCFSWTHLLVAAKVNRLEDCLKMMDGFSQIVDFWSFSMAAVNFKII